MRHVRSRTGKNLENIRVSPPRIRWMKGPNIERQYTGIPVNVLMIFGTKRAARGLNEQA
jgi:hypothetical protein